MLYCINLYLLQDCLSGNSIYQKIKNLLTLILMRTSIYSKMIEILKHCIYQNSCIKFLTFQFFWKIIKFSLKNAFLCSWGFVNILTQKLGFKKSSLSEVYAPRFQPVGDLVKTGIKKFKFKLSLCTQISPSWWLEFKSGVQVEFKWSFEVEFCNPSFHPDLVKTGIQKVEFKSSLCTQILPS